MTKPPRKRHAYRSTAVYQLWRRVERPPGIDPTPRLPLYCGAAKEAAGQLQGTWHMGFSACEIVSPAAESRPAVEWEETACPLCGRHLWELLLEAPDTVADGSGLWFAVV